MEAWLAPFERNVTQFVRLQAEAANNTAAGPQAAGGARPRRWIFALHIQRRSGPAYLWLRSNRAFVDALRKHLLNWRAMSSAQIEQFVTQAEMLFGIVGPL
jgi:hypothetical protein